MNTDILKSKSVWLGITTIIGAVAGYLTKTMTPVEAMQTALGGLAVIFIRDGISTETKALK